MVDPIKALFLNDSDEVCSKKEPIPMGNVVSNTNKTTKSFSLEGIGNAISIQPEETMPSPMHMIKDQQEKKSPSNSTDLEDSDRKILSGQLSHLKNQFSDLANNLENSEPFENVETHQASKVMDLLNQDLREIAQNTNQEHKEISEQSEENFGFAHKALSWCYSGEKILHDALLFLSDQKGTASDLGSYLKLQYAVQRAAQRTELFASLVGITISSIKTVMTTQLG